MITSFTEYLAEQEYREFCALDFSRLDEGLLDKLTGPIKKKANFVLDIAKKTKFKVSELAKVFKNRDVYSLFGKVKWSFDKLLSFLKKGYKSYGVLINTISEFLANNPVTKWTDKKIKELDNFLKSHPKTKKIVGVGVAALLIYVWFNVAFSGDVSTDFDMSDIISAFSGSYSLSDIFSGANGIKMIGLLLGGAMGGGFPWPTHANIQFVTAIIGTLASKFRR